MNVVTPGHLLADDRRGLWDGEHKGAPWHVTGSPADIQYMIAFFFRKISDYVDSDFLFL